MQWFNFKNMLVAAIAGLCLTPALAQKSMDLPKNHFVALTFHDVRDDVKKMGDHDVYAISTKNLSSFLDWIKVANWTPITLKQLQQAKDEGKALPENAVLLSFDDGSLSSYSRVFPLLKHYHVPAVFAIPTSWINGNTQDAYAAYGVDNLMNWDQMREMQASGLVEFASHSDDMHKGILANPQQNQKAAAITYAYLPDQQRYENDQEFKQRIYADLKRSKQILDQELGQNTSAIIWPYGAVNNETTNIAAEAGFPLSFGLGKTVANAKEDTTYQRLLIMDNPVPEAIYNQVHNVFKHVDDPLHKPLRFLQFDLAQIASKDLNLADQQLGQLIDQLDAFKSNVLILDVLQDQNQDGRYDTAFFPTTHFTQHIDLLSRAAWQTKTRAGQFVMVNLPLQPDVQQPNLTIELATEVVKLNPSLTSISLDAQQQLSCLWTAQRLTQTCQDNLAKVGRMQKQISQRVSPYVNISDSYFSTLKVSVAAADTAIAKDTTTVRDNVLKLLQQTDFLLMDVDVLAQPKTLSNLLKAIAELSSDQKRKIGINLRIPSELDHQALKLLAQSYVQIQQSGIQKFGASPYRLAQAAQIHQQLYPALSLNASPVTYRSPNQK